MALHKLHGSTEPRRADEPVPTGDLSEPPDHFSVAQADVWRYALENSPPGMLKRIDRTALEAWVVAADLHRQATAAQAKMGLVIKAPKTGVPIQSPYLPIINRQALIMLKAASELGFTPVSRPRISAGLRNPELPYDQRAPQGGGESIEAYLASAPKAKALH